MNIGMAGTKLTEFFTKEGLKKAGQQAVKAATSKGAQQAGKRVLRDTLLYTAAEQAIPRALGADAPPLKDTLVRQAAGNIVAEGATAGLKKAFPVRAAGADPNQMNMFTGKKEGKNLFGMPGLSAGDARKIGEVAGQVGGQAIAQRVLPGEQANPFLPSTYMQEDPQAFSNEYSALQERITSRNANPTPEEVSRFNQMTQQAQDFGTGPKTATGATKFTAEPESAQVVRPSTTDLSAVQTREALSEREKYEYRLKMAQIEKMPSMVMHSSPDSTAQTMFNVAQSVLNPKMQY
jgi:hypothetical protein